MQTNRQSTNWNPQIALGVVALGIIAAVWLNMAKLKMGMGQPQHDISQVPIAQNVTSDEIEQLRVGKPLALILAERPDYGQLAGTGGTTGTTGTAGTAGTAGTDRGMQRGQTAEQTSTVFSSSSRAGGVPDPKADSAGRSDEGAPQSLPVADAPHAVADAPHGQSGFRAPLRDPAVKPIGFSPKPTTQPAPAPEPESPRTAPEPIAPQRVSGAVPQAAVPRANPAGSFGSTGGSFLEKFPGQSQQLPNVKHGPAKNSPAPSILPEPAAEPKPQLPNATELLPPPFGNLVTADSSAAAVSEKRPAEPTATYPALLTIAGDTWWTLAQRAYDDGRLFRELYEFNRKDFPDYNQLPPGRQVTCPPLEVLTQQPLPSGNGEGEATTDRSRRYQTRAGETLFEIARGQLGQASRFAELLRLNRDRLPPGAGHLTPLPAGTELVLPQR